jgi:ABC-type transport system involved in multi-copper enzyme maturation permease subunit
MNLPVALFAIRCMVRDTFRQSLASSVFWVMLVVTGLCVLLCLSVGIEGGQPLRDPGGRELYGADGQPYTGVNPSQGQLTLAFGAVRLGLFRDGEAQVRFLQAVLANWVAGAVGTLLALVWTAGFIPEFLQPGAASVLLAKPVPRWSILVGKYLGVLAFVAFQATVFVVGTWAALGLKTGYWLPGYLLAIPLLLLNFAFIYSFATVIAVWTRSTAASVFGGVLFWVLCCGMNYARHAAIAQPALAPESAPYPAGFRAVVEAGYWFLPKPADLAILLHRALQQGHLSLAKAFEVMLSQGAFYPELSLLTSAAFAVLMLAVAARQLATTDY